MTSLLVIENCISEIKLLRDVIEREQGPKEAERFVKEALEAVEEVKRLYEEE